MRKKLLVILLLFTTIVFGQRKYFADRYFDEFAYKKSAELYENLYEKGDTSAYVLSRIGDSYYNNSEYEKAEQWYEELLKNYDGEVSTEYYFKYAQTLKSNGKVDASDKWMLKFRNIDSQDSRPQALEENRDYFSEYTNKNTVYLNVHNISQNTEYSDFGGFIYDNKLFFASTKPYSKETQRIYRWNNQPFLNVYTADQQEITEERILDVDTAQKFDDVNSKYHESNVVFTKDGNTLYFTRDNYDGRKLRKDRENTVNLKLYRSDKVDGKWSDVVELPFNSNDYSVGHPALSPDEETLYFVSDMPGGVGMTDLYKVSISDNHKTYGTPVNLGKTINTEGKEMFPYVGENNTLYFSSNGHLGLGALDIFESKVSGDSFTEPVNLAKPINGPMDDFAFVINEELTNGYFSSNREGGKGDDDIYSFIISICKESIEGIVTEVTTKEPINEATVKLIDKSGKVLAEQVTKADGKYAFTDLLCETDFTVVATKSDYRQDQKEVATIDVDKEIIEANLQLESLIQAPVVNATEALPQIVIRPIYFDFDKYNIREDARYELEHIVDVMRNNPEMVIKIESHTDSRATRAYNRVLSDNRAKSTRSYLISRGIASNRIESAIGYGEDRLLNHCDDANMKKCSEEEHQLNRRSYFYIVKGANNVRVVEQQGE